MLTYNPTTSQILLDGQPIETAQQITYYPRQGKPGHQVTILEVRPHPYHRAFIRFRYADGREREVTIGRLFTEE